ncbi:UbiD family decarboxylase [Chitinophaga sancti]|uniref:4-hydroxy-3-polyprenylbenzoate decarboxylase n=1 Tax=Chitinophaga sancti TaxID=1004 RepID=A0A1K1RPC3_9BACT|nr:UbiD family decarboxylase [Chitinophaga sancti]WQD62584.1 UbiD family decarboxylase [Chitinophaga sancti]WQG91847.1 UbiD family decarboxylase [Chitinophaga sancti]SFW73746.1 4-hydroxy-3-polyprenylbenzoate decarboxylase [Chitinophaga sancti]
MSQQNKPIAIDDLRSALELLKTIPQQYHETNVEIDPNADLAGVYKQIGAGGTVQRPTRLGPAMMFNNIKGYPGAKVLVGLLADRERVAAMLGAPSVELGKYMGQAVKNCIAPIVVANAGAPCQEVVYKASDKDFDLRKILPAPTNTPEDAGPYFCEGLVLGSDPETGHSDVTIHRLCVQGKDSISIYFAPGRHIDAFREKAEKAGKPLPVTINMSLDPAIMIGSCFEAPTTPFGFDELSIAGGLRKKPVELVKALTVNQHSIAKAEIVIEGEILPNVRVVEDQNTNTGHAMPEFPGYNGPANQSLPLIRVTAITTRKNPIMQTLIGPGEEHTNLAGIPTEASIYNAVEAALPGLLKNVYAHTAGGGKFMSILQIQKTKPTDQGRERQAALVAFAAYYELKQVILVDEDVDIFDSNDVFWAMTTRYQGDISTIFIPGVRCHPLDPSQDPSFDPKILGKGISTKTIFDCTVPWNLKAKFKRAQFKEVDATPYLPEWFK